METGSWRMRSNAAFFACVLQSRPSIGSQLSTWTLIRFERLDSGSESKRTSLPPSRVTHPRRFLASSTRYAFCAISRSRVVRFVYDETEIAQSFLALLRLDSRQI